MALRRALVFLGMLPYTLAPLFVYAQVPSRIVPCDGLDCNLCSLGELASNILNTAIFMSVFISALLFAYAGWLYLTNEAIGGQQRAKDLFKNVTIGLVIILISWLVVDTLMRTITGDRLGPWNSLCVS